MRYLRTVVLLLALLGVACDSDVTEPGLEPVAMVEVTAPAPSLRIGEALQLTATPRAQDGAPLGGRSVTWSSGDESIGRVSATGLLTGRGEGFVMVYATSEGRRGELRLEVRAPEVARVAIEPAEALVVDSGATVQLRAIAYADDDGEIPGRTASWSSSAEATVRVSAAGVMEARRSGSAIVTATIEGKSAQLAVTVRAAPAPVASLVVSPDSLTLEVGGAHAMTARLYAADGSELPAQGVAWSSSDETVALVTPGGVVTGRGPGTARITAEAEGVSGEATIIVHGWLEASLVSLDDRALPAVWQTTTFTDDQGVQLRRIIKVAAGLLQVDPTAGRYVQKLTLERWEEWYVLVNDEPVFLGVYLVESRLFEDRGTAGPIHDGSGTLIFRSEVIPGQTFTGHGTGDGFEVTEAINGFGEPVRLRFEG